MSFSIAKTMNKTTLPLKGADVVTVTITMESELAAKPRDIVIAWDYFGKEISNTYLSRMGDAILDVLRDLVGLSGGTDGKLGGGSRVALYGNRSNTGEIRMELSADTAPVGAALQAAEENPQPGLAVAADSIVEMLAASTNQKTLLVCGLAADTALKTAERDKLLNAGIEIFTLGGPDPGEAEPWGGLANSSVERHGPAVTMAGMPQNMLIEDYLGYQFRGESPMEATTGDMRYKGPKINKPYRMYWEVGAPLAKTGVQTYTMTYTARNIGPDVGEQTVSTLYAVPNAIKGGPIGEEITGLTGQTLTVNIEGDPAPTPGGDGGTDPAPTPGGDGGTDPAPTPGGDGGTDPAPTPGGDGGTDPAPTPGGDGGTDPAPGGGVQAENWPEPAAITVGSCKDAVQATIPEAQLLSLGRLVQLDVVLKHICPGKRVSATILLTEKNRDGIEETRAMKHILVPAQTGTECADVTLRCIQFSVPEALDLNGDPASICNERNFNVRVIANYVDSDMILCDTSTATV